MGRLMVQPCGLADDEDLKGQDDGHVDGRQDQHGQDPGVDDTKLFSIYRSKLECLYLGNFCFSKAWPYSCFSLKSYSFIKKIFDFFEKEKHSSLFGQNLNYICNILTDSETK